jgi:3-deoxy-D-manno-octulosonic-acid transferase
MAFWLAAPRLLLKLNRRGPWRESFGQRFGHYRPGALPGRAPGTRRLWLHAVSVGEVNTCLQFVRSLRERLPTVEIILSTTTNTGMAELRRKLPAGAIPIYFPVDQRGNVRRALDAVRPDAVILVEREIWPNFLWELRERALPVFLINARISERSHRSYRRYRFLFRSLYAQFDRVVAQTSTDADRLCTVGCRSDRLHVHGSMKFDVPQTSVTPELDVRTLMTRAGRRPGSLVLVAGSTHDGEELLLAKLAARLRYEFPELFLVLVPRHFERCSAVADQLRGAQITPVLRSSLDRGQPLESPGDQTLLVDSTGELTAFYEAADLVFVGKSLCARGGQNPIEPAALGKPVVMGPQMQNFPGVTEQLVEAGGARQVRSAEELESTLATLLRSPTDRASMGHQAREVVLRNAGATERTTALIVDRLTELWSRPTDRPGSGSC